MSRLVSSYVEVLVKKGKTFVEVGKTETILNSSELDFQTEIGFYYRMENEDSRKIIFKIYDGDTLGLKRGYVLAHMETLIHDLMMDPSCPIIDSNSSTPLGTLTVESTVFLKKSSFGGVYLYIIIL
jgi:hypothetical protein